MYKLLKHPFHFCFVEQHKTVLESRLKNEKPFLEIHENCANLLCEASLAGRVDIVDLLIKRGADFNQSGENGTTPFREASRAGHEDIMDLLIKSGADRYK